MHSIHRFHRVGTVTFLALLLSGVAHAENAKQCRQDEEGSWGHCDETDNLQHPQEVPDNLDLLQVSTKVRFSRERASSSTENLLDGHQPHGGYKRPDPSLVQQQSVHEASQTATTAVSKGSKCKMWCKKIKSNMCTKKYEWFCGGCAECSSPPAPSPKDSKCEMWCKEDKSNMCTKKYEPFCGGCAECSSPPAPSPKDSKPACADIPDWDAGYGLCATYGGENKDYCDTDVDQKSGTFAKDACPECGLCTAGSSPAPSPAPVSKPACADIPDWDAGYGLCDTYDKQGENSGYCSTDQGTNGVYAKDVCPECGECAVFSK